MKHNAPQLDWVPLELKNTDAIIREGMDAISTYTTLKVGCDRDDSVQNDTPPRINTSVLVTTNDILVVCPGSCKGTRVCSHEAGNALEACSCESILLPDSTPRFHSEVGPPPPPGTPLDRSFFDSSLHPLFLTLARLPPSS